MTFIEEKIRVSIDNLKNLIATERVDIPCVDFLPCDYKSGTEFPGADAGWQPLNTGIVPMEKEGHFWLHFKVSVPAVEPQKKVYLRMTTGFEDQWEGRNPQCIVYVNGNMATQAFDTNHTELYLSAGEKDIYIYFYTGNEAVKNKNAVLLLQIFTEQWDSAIEKLYYDLLVPYEAMKSIKKLQKAEHSQDYYQLYKVLDSATQLLDFRASYSEEFYAGLAKASDYLQTELYEKLCGKSKQEIAYIGHTHIDIAWLWTVAQTREKAQRSFSTVLELMRRFDDYIFMSSQPILYQMVKEEDPKLYAAIKERVAEGRWEVEGAMWLEADTNITGGESLIRQILYGKRFMREEFGVESRCLWLPDVFGYSAALPQILRKSGIDRFFTTKISWNETNKFPHDTFIWKGMDGTEIFSAFASSYAKPLNADLTLYTALNYKDKEYSDVQISTFGFGDGGGGPTKWMLENYERLKYGIPGIPKVTMRRSGEVIDEIEEKFNKSCAEFKFTPKWVGELYLEMHRGTYTTLAKAKLHNRKSELLYQKTEAALTTAGLLCGTEYPQKMLHDAWQVILLNQFHDIIPGTCIEEVYEVCDREYAKLLTEGQDLFDKTLQTIAGKVETKGGLFVYNPNSFNYTGIVETADGPVYVRDIPAIGYAVVTPETPENSILRAENRQLENELLRVCFDDKMQLSSIYDKANGRELLPSNQAANLLEVFEDCPRDYDAWEITEYYKQKRWIIDDVESVEYFVQPLCCGVTVQRRYHNSVLKQKIMLKTGSARLDFETFVDWHEDHVLLKAAFPLDIQAEQANYEIQFGHVSRPTHYNTSWDEAKFEVSAHRWADLSEKDYGVSLLNNCKYGYSCEGNVLKISLIKSPLYPNKNADRGEHYFTYSIFPHQGHSVLGGVVQQGYALNNPPTAFKLSAQAGTLPERYSLIAANRENVIVEAVKQAENAESTIVRVYEAYGCKTTAQFTVPEKVKKAYLCDMMENRLEELPIENKTVQLSFHPLEIHTLCLETK